MLSDPALETRARAISAELRCLVCQNQSIDDSDADLAKDLRHLVRERLVAGDSDAQVLAFITQRYGDFVLLRPPVKPATWLLWFGPLAVLLVGGGLLFAYFRGRNRTVEPVPELGPACVPGVPDANRRFASAIIAASSCFIDVSLGLWTLGASRNPRFDQRSELRLRARRRQPPLARMPRPAD